MSIPGTAGHLLAPVFAAGFFESEAVGNAVLAGALVAIVGGVVGVFTVIRGQSFAGESFKDIGMAGGAGSFLIGVGTLWGFVIGNLIGAGAMELIGIQRPRGRDLATGIVLGAAIGLAALFLYLGVTTRTTTGATVSILFGSAFSIAGSTIPAVAILSAFVLAAVVLLYRQLLLSSLNAEIAAARGIPMRAIGALHLVLVALAVALAAITIGAILSTALLIGPAATALRLARRPLHAMLLAAGIGIAAMWLGIVLAYDSYRWPPGGHTWPVSFFVVSLVFAAYLLSGVPGLLGRRRVNTKVADAPSTLPVGLEG